MENKYIRGLMAGSILGITAGVFILPRLGDNMKKRILQGKEIIIEGASKHSD